MSLVKCKYCNTRVRPTQIALHHKRCVNYRRLLKAGKITTTAVKNVTEAKNITETKKSSRIDKIKASLIGKKA